MAYSLLLSSTLCGKDAKLDVVTISCAIGVAGYTAIAMDYVAMYDLELSLEEIRDYISSDRGHGSNGSGDPLVR